VVGLTLRQLYPQGKSPWHPLERRLGGPQRRSGHGGEEKNSQPPPGIEPQSTKLGSSDFIWDVMLPRPETHAYRLLMYAQWCVRNALQWHRRSSFIASRSCAGFRDSRLRHAQSHLAHVSRQLQTCHRCVISF
jgi:hypothetical protein